MAPGILFLRIRGATMQMFCKISIGVFCKFFSQEILVCTVHIILILDATFVPNLTFLGFLSPEILFGEKTDTHADTQLISPSVNLKASH